MVSSGLSCSNMARRCLCRAFDVPMSFFSREVAVEEVSSLQFPVSPSSSSTTAPLTRAKLSLETETSQPDVVFAVVLFKMCSSISSEVIYVPFLKSSSSFEPFIL